MSAPHVEGALFQQLRAALPAQLLGMLSTRRWFGGKGRAIQSTQVVDCIPVRLKRTVAYILFLRVTYAEGPDETYVLPTVPLEEDPDASMVAGAPVLRIPGQEGTTHLLLGDALANQEFLSFLFEAVAGRMHFPGMAGEMRADHTSVFHSLRDSSGAMPRGKLMKAEQSNTSIAYGQSLILKFFRRLEEGINPDLELGLYLTEKAHFPQIPPVAGWLEYESEDGRKMALGMLQGFVSNQGDAWQYTLTALSKFCAIVSADPEGVQGVRSPGQFHGLSDPDLPDELRAAVQEYGAAAALLGKRTAELHLALASATSDPAFTPEPFTPSFCKSLEDSLRELTRRTFRLLHGRLNSLPEHLRGQAEKVAALEGNVLKKFHLALQGRISAMRTRIHGDYHLGQVLVTGSDMVIIDFEGEPARPLSERRAKRSPLQDVAGMLQSFRYASQAPLHVPAAGGMAARGDFHHLEQWLERWHSFVSSRFLESYFERSGSACYLPSKQEECVSLLNLHLLEKAVYELGYELNNRPEWLGIPLGSIPKLLEQRE